MIALATMQGMGKPGSNIYSTTQGSPVDYDFYFPGYAEGGISGDCENSAAGFKFAWRMFDGKTTFPAPTTSTPPPASTSRGSRCPSASWTASWSGRAKASAGRHPAPVPSVPVSGSRLSEDQDDVQVRGPLIGTMTDTNRYAQMYTHPSLEFVVSQSIWFEGEVPFADVILPACTNFERWDISEFANCSGYIPDNYPSATIA